MQSPRFNKITFLSVKTLIGLQWQSDECSNSSSDNAHPDSVATGAHIASNWIFHNELWVREIFVVIFD